MDVAAGHATEDERPQIIRVALGVLVAFRARFGEVDSATIQRTRMAPGQVDAEIRTRDRLRRLRLRAVPEVELVGLCRELLVLVLLLLQLFSSGPPAPAGRLRRCPRHNLRQTTQYCSRKTVCSTPQSTQPMLPFIDVAQPNACMQTLRKNRLRCVAHAT